MTKAKVQNYTEEQVVELVFAYTAAETDEARAACVEAYAEKFEKSPASIRAKLVREKLYIKPEKAGKKGGIQKADLVEEISNFTETPVEILDSLSKATMVALTRVVETFRELSQDKADLLEEMNGNPTE